METLIIHGMTPDEYIHVEKEMLHMKIDLRSKTMQSEVNENLEIFAQRFRCESRERFRDSVRLTRYFLPTNSNMRFLLSCIFGVNNVEQLDDHLARNIVLIYPRNYSHHFLSLELVRDIEMVLKNFLPVTVNFSVRPTNDPGRNNVIILTVSNEGSFN